MLALLLAVLATQAVSAQPAAAIGQPGRGRTVARVETASGVTTTVPPLGDRFCISITATPGVSWADVTYRTMAAQGANLSCATTNAAGLSAHGGTVDWTLEDGAGNCTNLPSSTGWTGTTTHRVTGCVSPGRMVLCRNGATVATSGTPRALNNTTPASWKLGLSVVAHSDWGGTLRDFRACKGATSCSDCP